VLQYFSAKVESAKDFKSNKASIEALFFM